MKLPVIFFCALSLLSVRCDGAENEQCTDHSAKYYSEALSKRLTLNGVPHTFNLGRGVCFAPVKAAEVDKASREVDQYFWEVATAFTDSCEEKAFVAWAEKEKLRFEVFESMNAARKPSGRRLVTIYSMSKEDVDVNRRKLWNEAPKGIRCAK